MEDILYFEINSGISGDMTIASLLDLGVNQDKFLKKLKKLNLAGYEIEISTVQKNGITATDFKVILENESHLYRNFNDIKKLINQSDLSQKVKDLSINIFTKVAAAEAKVHNKDIKEVHFHEVGAVDSIVDIVGAAILVEMINPDHIYVSPVSLGTGFIDAAHGKIPVPAPATIEILKDIPVYSTGVRGELVTPTGAAIIKSLAEKFIELPETEIAKIAYGAGKKDFEITNLLRVYQVKKKVKSKKKLLILETNIDDMSGEIYSYLFPKLFAAGAKDVYLSNIMMKKNRPAQKLTVLTTEKERKELEEIIFRETTTLGIRRREVERSCLERKYLELDSTLGKATIKAAYYEGELIKYSPEYEECKEIAERERVRLQDVYDLLKKEAAEKLF